MRRPVRFLALFAALFAGLLTSGIGATPAGAQSAAPGTTLPVPIYLQARSLSCEEAALQMVLAYHGRRLGQDAILNEIGVDLAHPLTGRSGRRSGDPFTSFVGDPSGSELIGTGYGTYYPTIAAVARRHGLGLLAAGQWISPATVYGMVRRGHPVIAWINFRWRYVPPWSYTAFDGRSVIYAGPDEHAVVGVGASRSSVLVNDPDHGRYWVGRATFEAAFATYHDMAVAVS